METIKRLFAITTVCLLFVAVSSFDNGQKIEAKSVNCQHFTNDTFPDIVIDFSEIFNQVGTALQQVTVEINKIDLSSLQREMEIAFKDININKFFDDISNAIDEVDTKKIANSLRKKMSSSEMEKAKTEVNKAIEELKKVDLVKIQKALTNIKIEIDPKQKEELQKNMEKIKPQLNRKMEELKIELEKLKKEVKRGQNDNYTNLNNLEYEQAKMIITPTI